MGSIDKLSDFFPTEHLRQVEYLLRIGRLGSAPGLLQHLGVKEAQSAETLRHRVLRQLPLAKHGRLILPNMLQAQLVGRTMKVPGKVLDRVNVAANSPRGVVATLQLLKHELT
jgi:hypothetical protein